MNPTQPEATPEQQPRSTPSSDQAARSNGEHRSFHPVHPVGAWPGGVWREDQADAKGDSYSGAARDGAVQPPSEAATNLRDGFEALASMQLATGRLLDDWLWRMVSWNALPTLWPAHPLRGPGLAPLPGRPAADVKETEQGYAFCMELPGLTSDDIDIQVRGDVITVSGQKSEGSEEASPTYHVSERRFGRFERSFPIPSDVDRTAVKADVRNGVLSITLPRKAAAEA